MNNIKHSILFLVVLFIFSVTESNAQQSPKREFRGAWIQCVNGQFNGMGMEQMQQTLSFQLDEMQKSGINAIIFQVRAEADALYPSKIEPWSRFLSGKQGVAPSPYWDPLQWMIEQCHKRGMELHAWINPFRAKTKNTTDLASNHIAVTHPDQVFDYGDLKIINPGIPENRSYICSVVSDILHRYDVDGIHMDDYFYPYPEAGQVINDDYAYAKYNNGISDRGDWRRYCVNLFIKELADTIHSIKPWVKFGVSPFGIYRNKKSDPTNGSDTHGTQNYDDLYADVLLWVNNGWVDYCIPQLYWQIGHPAADYEVLIKWWNRYAAHRPIFIGQDVLRTVQYPDVNNPQINQQPAKFTLERQLKNISGACFWYAKSLVDNPGNYATVLRNNYFHEPALQPEMTFITKKAPSKVKRLKGVWTNDGYMLFWTAPHSRHWAEQPYYYVVYKFAKDEKIDISDPSHIVDITHDTFVKLPYDSGKQKFCYVVTALNRIQNESRPAKKKIKL